MEKKMYVAPAVEVLEVMVELGFNASQGIEGGGAGIQGPGSDIEW